MVDALVSVFLDRLVAVIEEESRSILQFQEQFREMNRQLKFMQSFLKDAERMRRKVHTLRTITDELRELIYDAEDVLLDCSNVGVLAAKKKPATCCLIILSPADLPFRAQAGRRLKEINGKIKQIKEDMMSYLPPSLVIQNGTDDLSNDAKRRSSPVFDQTQVVGLDADADKIKGWLSGATASTGLTVIGIVGMGGLGKTTTAQKVFNDREVEDRFEKRLWVSVSQTFVEEDVLRSMLKNLGDTSIGDDLGGLLSKIHHYLQGKRYLIILDDVWDGRNGWWGQLFDGLPKSSGGCIIVTTRNEHVARQMGVTEGRLHRPRLLATEESWSLFRRIAFAGNGGACRDPKLEEVGREIVKKCGGLPLAIKTVGGMIFCKQPSVIEWRRISTNFSEELAQSEGSSPIMASLRLSYDELPSYLKPCFLCFSIYPEDSVVLKDQLVYWWIAEGLLPGKSRRSPIEIGEDCFTGLLNRCLVEAIDRKFSGEVLTCKIHDMVRDLVIEMAKEEGFLQPEDGRHRRLGLSGSVERKDLHSNSTLRALVSTASKQAVNKLNPASAEQICDCRRLRVLDLSESIFEAHIGEALRKLSSLQGLAYLSLRNVHPMTGAPRSLGRLKNLRILDMSSCHNLTALPAGVVALEKLVVLDVSSCGSLNCLPRGLSRLVNLEVLKGFRPSRAGFTDGCSFGELKSLTRLKTLELWIRRDGEIAREESSAMSGLGELQRLTISCFDGYGAELRSELEQLSLPRQLSELNLRFFPGEETPRWLNPVSLPDLQLLSISHCCFERFKAGFWGGEGVAWGLRGLLLETLPDLVADWRAVLGAVPCLELVHASWCPKLSTFPVDDIGFNGGVWRRRLDVANQVDSG